MNAVEMAAKLLKIEDRIRQVTTLDSTVYAEDPDREGVVFEINEVVYDGDGNIVLKYK